MSPPGGPDPELSMDIRNIRTDESVVITSDEPSPKKGKNQILTFELGVKANVT